MKNEQNGVNTDPANSRMRLNLSVDTAIRTQVDHMTILRPIRRILNLPFLSLKYLALRLGMSAIISELNIVFERNVNIVVSM